MDIAPAANTLLTPHARRVTAEQAVQNVFAQVLATAGRDGYASAEAPALGPASDEQVTSSWNDWLAILGRTRYGNLENAQTTLSDFNELLLEAQQAGAYAAPQAYVSQLDSARLNTLQQVHHLAFPIEPEKLSEEGALNLLLPPPAQVDLNHDGLTQSGIGYTIRFPDSRTPRAVVDAWHEATADLSDSERTLRELQMKVDVLLANIHVDASGRFVSRTEPGEPGFVNPQADPEYSFVKKVQDTIESVEYFKNQTPLEQYRRDMAFWTSLRDELTSHGAA